MNVNGQYTIKNKDDLYLGDDGEWYALVDLVKIKFYTAYLPASQDAVKLDASVSTSTEMLKWILVDSLADGLAKKDGGNK